MDHADRLQTIAPQQRLQPRPVDPLRRLPDRAEIEDERFAIEEVGHATEHLVHRVGERARLRGLDHGQGCTKRRIAELDRACGRGGGHGLKGLQNQASVLMAMRSGKGVTIA